MFHKWLTHSLSACMLALAASAAIAAPPEDGNETSAKLPEAVQSLVGPQTMMVARVRVEKIDFEALIDKVKQISDLPPKVVRDAVQTIQVLRDHAEKIEAAYKIFDYGTGWFVVVLLEEDASFDAVFPAREQDDFFRRKGALVFWADPAAVRKIKPADRSAVEAALEAVAGMPFQAVAVWPADQDLRRAMLALWVTPVPYERWQIERLRRLYPALAQALSSGRLRDLLAHTRWIAAGAELPPELRLKLVIQMDEKEAARRMRDLLSQILDDLATHDAFQQEFPKWRGILALAEPEVRGKRVVAEVEGKEADRLWTWIHDHEEFIEMVSSERVAKLCLAAYHLRVIGDALRAYAKAHDSELPAHVGVLLGESDLRAELFQSPFQADCKGKDQPPEYDPQAEVGPIYRFGDYVFTYLGTQGIEAPTRVIWAFSARPHAGKRVVLYADGHVEIVSEQRYEQLIQRQNRMRREKSDAPPIKPEAWRSDQSNRTRKNAN